MSVKIKLGSYVLDSARSGNTSTTTGLRLAFPDGPHISYNKDRNGFDINFLVYCEGITGTANIKTALDALENVITNTVNADFEIELDGVAWRQFKVSDNVFSRITGKVYSEIARDGFIAAVTVTAERAGTASGSAGDVADAIEPLEWDYAQSVGGLARAAVTGVFKKRTSAVAFVQGLRDGTNVPPWLPTATWQFTAQPVYKFEQQLNQTSPVGESAYTPCRVSVFMAELPASMASTMKSTKCKDFTYRATLRPAAPLNANAGHAPGYEFTLVGTLEFQIDGNTSFDSADTVGNGRQTEAGLKAAAQTMIDALKANAETRLAMTFTKLGQDITVAGESGSVAFVWTGITGSATRVLSWAEKVTVHFGFQGEIFTLATGAQGVEGNKAGEAITVDHRLDVVALAPVAYRKPSIVQGDRWLRVEFAVDEIELEPSQDGPTKFTMGWHGFWKYLPTAGAGGIAGAQFSGVAFDSAGYLTPVGPDI